MTQHTAHVPVNAASGMTAQAAVIHKLALTRRRVLGSDAAPIEARSDAAVAIVVTSDSPETRRTWLVDVTYEWGGRA